ncbi:hypothetical protein BDF21DRAFT_457035 [Thamnidium elegans]|nr:hypothetical protein BDF21DRAFT_457035 [Thamnidium elegans]
MKEKEKEKWFFIGKSQIAYNKLSQIECSRSLKINYELPSIILFTPQLPIKIIYQPNRSLKGPMPRKKMDKNLIGSLVSGAKTRIGSFFSLKLNLEDLIKDSVNSLALRLSFI